MLYVDVRIIFYMNLIWCYEIKCLFGGIVKKIILILIFVGQFALADNSFKCIVQYGAKNQPDNLLTQVILTSQNEVIDFKFDEEIRIIFTIADVPNFADSYYHYLSEIKDTLSPYQIKITTIEGLSFSYSPRENTYNCKCERQ